jgi:cell division septum initiation protein DivIVA
MEETVLDTGIDAFRVAFRTRLFGFDKAEVRAYLSNLLREYEEAHDKVEALTRELNREPSALPTQSTTQQTDMAHLVERTLTSAHRVADEIRKEAEQERERLVAEAKTRVSVLFEKAASEATERRDAAVVRLREVEAEVERMQLRRRELITALESLVTALGETLADARTHSVFDTTEQSEADAVPVVVNRRT